MQNVHALTTLIGKGVPIPPTHHAGTSLDAASAHALVHAWETVRAAALGPRRARIHLAGVVAEPLLQQTLDTVGVVAWLVGDTVIKLRWRLIIG